MMPTAVPDCIRLHAALTAEKKNSETRTIVHETGNGNEVYEIEFSSKDTELPEFLEMLMPETPICDTSIEGSIPSHKIAKYRRLEVESPTFKKNGNQELVESISVPTLIEISDDDDDEEQSKDSTSSGSVTEVISDNIASNIKSGTKNGTNATVTAACLSVLINSLNIKLINDLDIKILIGIYNKNQRFIPEESFRLSTCIINLKNTDFQKIAVNIKETFPNEQMETYYLSEDLANHGFIVDAYNKYSSLIQLSGIREQIKWTTNVSKTQPPPAANSNSYVLLDTDEQEFINCRLNRMKMVKKRKFNVIEYMRLYPVLLSKTGYKLIEKDAEALYRQPELKGFVDNFFRIAKNIIAYAMEMKYSDHYVSSLLAYSKLLRDQKNQKLIAILLLPYILPQAVILITDTRPYIKTETTPLQSSVNFVRLYQHKAEETNLLESLLLDVPKLIVDNGSVHIKLYGEFHKSIKAVVRVGITTYNFDDPLRAVEVYFKIFVGLDLPYPIYSHHILDFFEKLAFNIKRPARPYQPIVPLDKYYEIFNK